ncbi:MAG: hypothetical protein HOO94_07525 [Novosphingobium sp.]|uniref:hypothetical protein n=1 Tax=Novosphingobium sp. TaxID=1874826 RepID=UPI00180DFBBE|nr:hypothetical protein [Novosphingobium sp.]
MRVAIPHSHSKDEVRQRLKARSGDIAGLIPGGMAEVTVSWPDEDTMTLAIGAMGQAIDARVELGEGEVVFTLDLPPALSFVEPMVRGALEQKGRKLLA